MLEESISEWEDAGKLLYANKEGKIKTMNRSLGPCYKWY